MDCSLNKFSRSQDFRFDLTLSRWRLWHQKSDAIWWVQSHMQQCPPAICQHFCLQFLIR